MTAALPLYALSGLAMAAATVAGLVWLRTRTPRAGEAAGPSQMRASTDYEQLFSLSPHPMFVYDAETLRFLAVNNTIIRRYGYQRAEFLKMNLADIRPAEDIPAMQAMAREVQKSTSAAVPGIWRHRRKDGSVFHVRISGHALAFSGRPARMVQVIDVSAEVALQAEREQMIGKLQHSREWLATAINAGRIALWERDLHAHTLVLGGRWADILGTTVQAFGPVTEQSFINMCHPDDLPRVSERFMAYLQNPSEPYADEFRVKHLQHGWIWVLSRGKIAERSSDGRARRVVGTYVDISDLKSAQSAREQQRAAEQASTMKSQFLGRVSHELRTPLNAVIGFSQLMQLDTATPLTPQQAERIAHIERAGQHLLGLITDLMDLSRIELGAVELQSVALDASELLDDSLAMVDTQLRERQLTVHREIDPALPPVMADPLRLRQCLINLLSNAVKYSDSQGTVRVDAHTGGNGMVALSVWNSGVGMTPQQLERLYEPFNRLGRDASHGEGTGIGLAISRQLIERMGGQITATSEAGAWAQFTVTLPTAAP
ncbi:MAG: PAS domain-containing protein [Cytophagales bacterium]|nr:PAS domain-containing protein [Rhizobacter sp.]